VPGIFLRRYGIHDLCLGPLEQVVAERAFCGKLGGRLGGETPSASEPVQPQCTKPAAEERVAGERIPILDRAAGPSSGMGFVGSGERIECSYGFEQAP